MAFPVPLIYLNFVVSLVHPTFGNDLAERQGFFAVEGLVEKGQHSRDFGRKVAAVFVQNQIFQNFARIF